MAEQLTVLDSEIFVRTHPIEYVNMIFSPKNAAGFVTVAVCRVVKKGDVLLWLQL